MLIRIALCTVLGLALPLAGALEQPYPTPSDGNDQTDDGRPMLGVNMSPVPVTVQREQNLTPDEGVYVRRTYDGTTAAHIGIQQGDVILDINGNAIDSMSAVRDTIFGSRVGDDVAVTVMRDGQRVDLDGRLGGWPQTIPLNDINEEAEQRYRDMQARRLAREAESAERELAHAQQELDAVQDAGPQRPAQAAPARSARADHPDRPDREPTRLERLLQRDTGSDLYGVIPAPRWDLGAFLPAWQMYLRVETDDPVWDELDRKSSATRPRPDGRYYELRDDLVQSLAPDLDLDYAFYESSEAL
ncbi:MAG: S1C family serine protease [Planctomycetota bacterium]